MLQWNQSLQQDWSLLDRNVKKKQECFSKYFQATTKRQLAVLTQQAFVLMKTYWRRLEDVFSVTIFRLSRRLEDVLKTSWRRLAKTFWRRLEEVLKTSLEEVLQTRLEDVLEDEELLRWRLPQDVFKRSWKIRNVYWERTARAPQKQIHITFVLKIN